MEIFKKYSVRAGDCSMEALTVIRPPRISKARLCAILGGNIQTAASARIHRAVLAIFEREESRVWNMSDCACGWVNSRCATVVSNGSFSQIGRILRLEARRYKVVLVRIWPNSPIYGTESNSFSSYYVIIYIEQSYI